MTLPRDIMAKGRPTLSQLLHVIGLLNYISLFEIWRAQKERGCFSLGNLLSAQFITQTEARPFLLCPPYFKKAYGMNTRQSLKSRGPRMPSLLFVSG